MQRRSDQPTRIIERGFPHIGQGEALGIREDESKDFRWIGIEEGFDCLEVIDDWAAVEEDLEGIRAL